MNKKLSWLDAGFLIFGGFVIVLFSAGAALAEIGLWSLLVWGLVVLVGVLQAFLLYKVSNVLPVRIGGTANYAHEAFLNVKFLSFLSGWSYWLAWTPAVALNSYLAAGLLKNLLPGLNVSAIVLAIILILLIYTINFFGLGKILVSSKIFAYCILPPLLILIFLGIKHFFTNGFIMPGSFFGILTPHSFFKWFFVIAWTGYAMEIVSTFVSEFKETASQKVKAFWLACLSSSLIFILLPLVLSFATNWQDLSQDTFTSLLPMFSAALGAGGGFILAWLLFFSLMYSSLSFVVPSTRTIFQMSKDGLMPKYFAKQNSFGAPVGSLYIDLILNIGLLLIFKAELVAMLATVNIAYILVFVLLPLASLRLSKKYFDLSGVRIKVLAWGLFILNLAVLIVGGFAWGLKVNVLGWILILAGLPIYWWTKWPKSFKI